MSQAAAQATAFYREVARSGRLWTIRDTQGYPAPVTPDGRAMPFWSSLARAERTIATVPAYRAFSPVELSWPDFTDKWLPGLERDGLRIGVNWTGIRATGYDLTPGEVRERIESALVRGRRDKTPPVEALIRDVAPLAQAAAARLRAEEREAIVSDELGHAIHARFWGGVAEQHNLTADGEPFGDCYKCRIVRDFIREWLAARDKEGSAG